MAPSKRVRLSDDQLQSMGKAELIAKINALEDELKQWKPSCRHGGAKFSYAGSLPSTAVFNVLTGQAFDAKKAKKMCSFTPADFEETMAEDDVSASVRYNTLHLVGKSVNVRWKEEDGEFAVNGSYGLSGTAF
ncbi:hypothetical protein EJ03DRAFT_361950 [Teratosphaeria nubilosa]|uniref:Uncharacterized protein n=1 Tax=Teratosphaeria nubilosa TaxID=161662 RepID=A0A6G1LB15_9PEZI|nr:hypothetical protein EJ03DRAFT_361950 [Teratosphaeria nubilosa]